MMHPVVVIAAGIASRLEPYSADTHKCLMELEPDVTILDFTLCKVENINSPRTLFVIRPSLRSAFEEKLKGKAELIETEEDEFGNLYSVSLASKSLDNGSFLLLMSDHIFEQSIINRIMMHESEAAFTVCLDQTPSRADLKEGLKLALKGDAVTKAGKTASPMHGIDTGIILCRENAATYINKAIDKYGVKATIANALNLAAADGNVDYVDVTGMLWKDVDTPEDLVKAREVYYHILRKELSKPEDGLVSRYLNRPISTRISLFAYRKGFGITPTAVSLISFILALSGSALLAIRWFIPAGLLVQLSSITDGVDGEIARLFHKASPWGGYLDSVLDRISDVAIVIGLTLSAATLDNLTLFRPARCRQRNPRKLRNTQSEKLGRKNGEPQKNPSNQRRKALRSLYHSNSCIAHLRTLFSGSSTVSLPVLFSVLGVKNRKTGNRSGKSEQTAQTRNSHRKKRNKQVTRKHDLQLHQTGSISARHPHDRPSCFRRLPPRLQRTRTQHRPPNIRSKPNRNHILRIPTHTSPKNNNRLRSQTPSQRGWSHRNHTKTHPSRRSLHRISHHTLDIPTPSTQVYLTNRRKRSKSSNTNNLRLLHPSPLRPRQNPIRNLRRILQRTSRKNKQKTPRKLLTATDTIRYLAY